MAGAGKKTFTAGETLTASDVNTYLMEQSVMYFGGTAARASAIPTPSTGMTSYIGVTGTASIPQLETYTGSAWQTPYGLTLLASVSFAGVSTINIDNVFSSRYQNYKVFINTTTQTADSAMGSQLRVGGVPLTTSSYGRQAYGILNHTTNTWQIENTVTNRLELGGYAQSGMGMAATADLLNPFETQPTYSFAYANSPVENRTLVTRLTNSLSYDGISFFTVSGGNYTGNIRIYGVRNS